MATHVEKLACDRVEVCTDLIQVHGPHSDKTTEYETMVFGGPHSGDSTTAFDKNAAYVAHKAMVAKVFGATPALTPIVTAKVVFAVQVLQSAARLCMKRESLDDSERTALADALKLATEFTERATDIVYFKSQNTKRA